MAVAKRRTLIANPRRKRRNARKLSLAQIRAGFGGKRRQSAAKHRKRNKPKAKAHRRRTRPVSNPVRHRKRAKQNVRATRRTSSHRKRNRRHSVRRNFGEIVSLGNPAQRRKKKSMAKAKRSKRHNASHRRHHRRNAHRMHHKRPNPMGGALGGDVVSVLYMIAGGVGSKMLSQVVLGTSNTGLIGYAANLAAGGILAWGVKGVMKNAAAARDVFKGAVLQVVLRAISDYTPFGQYTSQLGMGDYMASNWVTPQRYVDGLNSAQVQIPAGWGGVPAVAVSSSGVNATAMGASSDGAGLY